MLIVWTNSSVSKTLSNLSPVLKSCPTMPIEVVGDFSVTPETTIILSLGTPSLKFLQEKNLVPKNRTVTSLRTQPIFWKNIPILISYSPEIGDIDHSYYVDMLTDVGLAVRYHNLGTFKPKMGRYRYVKDFSETVHSIKLRHEVTGKSVDVMSDLETLGLDPYCLPTINHPGAYIITIQTTDELTFADEVVFYSRAEEEEALANPILREQIDFLLNCPYIRHKGANFKYDLHWLWVRGKFTCSNFSFDTTIVGSILNENRSNSLSNHVKIYAPRGSGYADHYDRNIDKSRMDLALKENPEEFLNYSGGDVDFGLEVALEEKKQLQEDKKLTRFYVTILHPASRAFEQIEQGGIFVDINAFKELQADLEKEQLRLITKASKIIGGLLTIKHNDPSRLGGLNLTKASLLTDFMFSCRGLNLKPKMFTEKPDKNNIQRPATSLEHLLMFAEDPNAKEFVSTVEEYSSVVKTYNTYVVGFLKHLRSDGRFHPSYYFYAGNKEEDEGGTNSGRLSAKSPAVQTIPQHTKWSTSIRRCYPAPPGYVIVSRDVNQGELRVIACVANEENMIDAYKQKLDLHVVTGGAVVGLDYAQMLALKKNDKERFLEIRQLAKSMGFGLAVSKGGLVSTLEEGNVKIENIQLYHHIWDGEEWVSHDGVISQGEYEVIEWDGVSATPDHKVWTEDNRKVELLTAAKEKARLARASTNIGEPRLWNLNSSSKPEDSIIRRTRLYGGDYYSTGNNISAEQKKELERLGIQTKRVRVYDILNAGPRRKFTYNNRLVSNCYGMMAEGFQTYARTGYGVVLTLDEATKARDTFFGRYPKLLIYHAEYKKLAKRDGFVRSPLGRVRHLPLINSPHKEFRAQAERQSVNSPIQSTLSDLVLWTLAIEWEQGLNVVAPAFGTVHDSIGNYVPEDKVDIIVPQQVGIMENLPFHKVGWHPQLSFLVDVKIGKTLGDLEDYKK